MTDVHQQNAHLKSQIDTGAREATVYLEKLKENVTEFDQKNKLPHTAAEYLNSGISTAESSIVELKDVAAHMSDKSEDKSEETMETARNSLQKVKDSLDSLQSTAREYDQKFMNGGGAETAGGIMKSVENLTNAARQRTTDAIEMASEQLTRMKDSVQNAASTAGYGVQVAVGEAARLGEKVDNTLGVSSVAASAAGGVSGTVKNLDKRLHVSETAANIDEKVTGGLGAKVMHKGVEMVHDSIEYISETLQQAKIAAGKSSTAQDVEGRATATGQSISQSVSDTTGAAGERMTAAKDQAAGMVLGARDRTLEMGTSAKQSVMSAAGMSTDRPATEQLKEGAYNAKESAKEGAYNAKDTAAYKTGDIRQSARETAESARQEGATLTDRLTEGAYSAKDTIANKLGDLRQGAYEMAGSAQQEGHDLKESAKEGAYNAKDTAAYKTGDIRQSARETAGSAQQTGHDLKEGVKEGAYNAKESAKEGAYNAKDKAAYKTGDIRQSARETAGSAQQTGHHLKEGAKEGAYNAKEGAKEGAYNAKESAKEGAYNARNKADEQGSRTTSEGYSQGYGTQQPSTFDYVKDKAKEMGTYAKETALGPGESATDQKRHEKRHEELYGTPSSGRHL